MKQVVNGKRYDTETAKLIADNRFWDGHNFERGGRNRFLYKTHKGNFFLLNLTQWQGEIDYIEPVSFSEAKNWYEKLSEHKIEWEEAFGETPEEA
tara:strand:+ start:2332 stop:2616 length:285 start_codon:yes stop_codon:yes gene_type:complete